MNGRVKGGRGGGCVCVRSKYLLLRRQHPLPLREVVYTSGCENTSSLLNDTYKRTHTIIIPLFYSLRFLFIPARLPLPLPGPLYFTSSLKLFLQVQNKLYQSVGVESVNTSEKGQRWEGEHVCACHLYHHVMLGAGITSLFLNLS